MTRETSDVQRSQAWGMRAHIAWVCYGVPYVYADVAVHVYFMCAHIRNQSPQSFV